jgi:predicted dehydrogenase
LGRTAAEVRSVTHAARAADRLLAVDMSYRFTEGMQKIRELAASGKLGNIFAADLVFHNAYGPGKPWFYDPALSGGGCVIDLGIHLVDLALWMLDFPEVCEARSRLLRDGRPLRPGEVEDYAWGELMLSNEAQLRIACSWNLNAGRDAVIEARFHGTSASAEMRNVDGSFFDFAAELFKGRETRRVSSPPDEWSGRAAVEWVRKLAAGNGFSGSTTGLLQTARALDRLYASA